MPSPVPLSIHLLGGFRVCVDNCWVAESAWRQKRVAAILKLLALEPSHRLHRERVRDILWPDLDRESQANNLRYSLHQARKRLEEAWATPGTFLFREGDLLVLGADDTVWVDVLAFEQTVADAWRLDDLALYERAAELYSGDLLPEDMYDDWLDGRRAALRTSYLALLARLGRRLREHGQPDRAIETFQRLVAAEPTQEEAHVALMQLHALAGRTRQAVAQYDRLSEVLERELGAEPEFITRALLKAIQDGHFSATPAPITSFRSATEPAQLVPTNLPSPVSGLVGREREIAEVRLILSSSRLITLTGPGGIGKTRLSIAVGHQVRDRFDDGVFFVPLAPVRDVELVISSIAKALNAREIAGESLIDTLKTFSRFKRMLLVLDNFEHVVGAAPLVTELLEAAPEMKVLVTSRMRLRLRGEREYHVPPLNLPGDGGINTSTSVAEYSAVSLFVQTAQEVRPDFRVVDDNALAVATICRRLDGLPLAIELAAARMRVLPLQAILGRLEHPLSLLTGGSRDLPERQQTIRNTVKWSYDLLQSDEQQLLQRLSVFAGGWSLEAAETVAIPIAVGDVDVLDGLTGLVEASLVTHRTQPDGETRYGMLEIIREYALEQLVSVGNLPDARQRHAEHVAEFVEFRELLLFGPRQIETLDELEREHDNIRAALTWFHATEQACNGLALAGRLWRFWWLHGHFEEGQAWYERLRVLPDQDVPDKIRATALTGAGAMAELQHDLRSGVAFHEEAISIWLDLEPREQWLACWSFASLGSTYMNHGDYDLAERSYQDGLRLARKLNEPRVIALATGAVGLAFALRGRDDEALAFWEEALTFSRRGGEPFMVAFCTGNTGAILINKGDFERGKPLAEESIGLNRRLGNRAHVSSGLFMLSKVDLQQGDVESALQRIKEGMDLAREAGMSTEYYGGVLALGDALSQTGDHDGAIRCYQEGLQFVRQVVDPLLSIGFLIGYAKIFVDRGLPERAVTLVAAVSCLMTMADVALEQVEQADVEHVLARGREVLPAEAFAAAWECGCAMTLEEAIEYVLAG